MLTDYKTMYYTLAAQVAEAVELLISAQQQGEIQFIHQNEHSELTLLHKKLKNTNDVED